VLTREPLFPGRPRRTFRSNPRINALTLVLVAILAVGAILSGVQWLRQQTPASIQTAITPLTSAPPRTPAPTIPPGQGWSPAGPSWAQRIIFAPSQPQTAYVCGTPGNHDADGQAPVAIGISDDSGRTWQVIMTRLIAATCQMTVNPLDARDLLMAVGDCDTCSSPAPMRLYRTHDGGQSWSLVQFPSLDDSASPEFAWYQWAWQGSVVFVIPFSLGTQQRDSLAISVVGSPFIWINQASLLAQVPENMEISNVYATTSAVYVDFASFGPANCTDDCMLTKVSTDLGATWTIFRSRYHGQPVYLFDQFTSLANGQTLIAQVYSGQNDDARMYLHSGDGGATWTPLQSPPGGLVIASLASTPGGIMYAETWSFGGATAPSAVYRLAPGAKAWILVGALPNSGLPLVVSWDAQGNPLALWSGTGNPSSQPAGLVTHAP
jgi:hypothetical protein